MPLTGAHISCSAVSSGIRDSGLVLKSQPFWSKTFPSISSQQITSDSAPGVGSVCIEISAGIDLFYAVGKAPDATQSTSGGVNSARAFLPAGAKEQIFANPTDKVAVVAA